MLFKADFAFRRVVEITPSFLKKHDIRGLLMDLDNTLTTHDNPRPADGVLNWIENIRSSGIKMVIVSNNHPPRVKPFADMLGLEFISEGKKPLSCGFNRAQKLMDIPFKNLAVVGDQIFTDMLGANLKRIKGIFVYPIEKEGKHKKFLRFKRVIEKPFLPKLTENI
ncbi:MAG: YqeG family HAD IIIA-type phosphatase [Oscillospiraceae bacterium]|nr:YqeG family HAD IIIA-type phosphatase [Oscillospiraceae bacterium]